MKEGCAKAGHAPFVNLAPRQRADFRVGETAIWLIVAIVTRNLSTERRAWAAAEVSDGVLRNIMRG